MVGQVNLGKVDVASFFKDGGSVDPGTVEQTFQRPPKFDERLKSIKKKINKF